MIERLLILFIIILALWGCGYALGRRAGIKQGRQRGLVQCAIDLRINALEDGKCPICGYRPAKREKNHDPCLDCHAGREY